LDANTTANNNTAVGDAALTASTTGALNTAVGASALTTNTTGANNVAMGFAALQLATTASSNVALGYAALNANTTGANNTAVGASTGDNITTGTANVLFGYGTDANDGTQNSQHGFGYNLNCAASFTTLGNASADCRVAHGSATWATVSDERVKKDIEDSTAGLSFINDLKPKTFKYKTLGEIPSDFDYYEEGSTEHFKNNSKTNHGFIAQEIKTAIDNHPELKDGFELWNVRSTGQQEVAEAALIPILVKALQEADDKIDALTTRIEALEG